MSAAEFWVSSYVLIGLCVSLFTFLVWFDNLSILLISLSNFHMNSIDFLKNAISILAFIIFH